MRKVVITKFLVFIMISMIASCDKEDDPNVLKGSAKLEITDAPFDDSRVEGAFVTIADIKFDGKSVEGFSKTTIDLMAYQNGETKTLINSDFEARSYSKLTLVLDYESDENGNSPGCYIKDKDNKKHPLKSNGNEKDIRTSFLIEGNSQTEMVIDFDLRKCLTREDKPDDKYEFVSHSEFESGLRLVNKSETGTISGNCDDNESNSDKLVVYAYNKGEFNRESEINGTGTSNIKFSNAVTSSNVEVNGDYQLHFLEEGEYELHFCSYKENQNGEMQLNSTLNVNTGGSIDTGSVEVTSSTETNVDVTISGLL